MISSNISNNLRPLVFADFCSAHQILAYEDMSDTFVFWNIFNSCKNDLHVKLPLMLVHTVIFQRTLG